MLALVGPAVFDGTFYPYVHNIQIRMEHLITGPDVKEVNCFSLKCRTWNKHFGQEFISKVPEIQECDMSGKLHEEKSVFHPNYDF